MSNQPQGYRVTWTATTGEQKEMVFESLMFARKMLDNLEQTYPGIDVNLLPIRRTFNGLPLVQVIR